MCICCYPWYIYICMFMSVYMSMNCIYMIYVLMLAHLSYKQNTRLSITMLILQGVIFSMCPSSHRLLENWKTLGLLKVVVMSWQAGRSTMSTLRIWKFSNRLCLNMLGLLMIIPLKRFRLSKRSGVRRAACQLPKDMVARQSDHPLAAPAGDPAKKKRFGAGY